MTGRLLVLLPVFATSVLAMQAPPRPLPEHNAFVGAARQNLMRSQREQFKYSYKERRTEFRVNPFGRLGSGAIEGFEVTPIEKGTVLLRRLIERDGKPVADGDEDRIKVKEERRRPGRRSSTDDALAMLTFTLDHRETLHGREVIVVRFEPRADAKPETSEGRLAKLFKGLAWVDESACEVIRVEGTTIDEISVGYGLIAKLNQGTTVTLTREAIHDGTWLPTSIRFAGEGRAILFRKLNVDQRIEWFDYRKVD